MRLRNNAAALALACAAGAAAAAPAAAAAQNAEPRSVQVTPGPPGAPQSTTPPETPAGGPGTPPADERQRAIELYRAHFGGQLTKAPFLGVNTSTVPAALRQHLGLPEGVGLVVEFVEPESPAQSAGLKQYDIIKKLDDQILVNAQQLAVLVRARKAGDEVKLTLIRGGKEQSLSAKLVEKEVKPLGEIDFFDWAVPGEVPGAPRAGGAARRTTPELRGRTANPAAGGGRTMSEWREGDTTLTLLGNPDGSRQLMVREKGRHTIYQLNDAAGRAGIPPHLAEKVRQMESKLPASAGNGNGGGGGSGTAELRFEFEAHRDGSSQKEHNGQGRREEKKENGNKNDNDNENEDEKDDEGNDDDGEGREASARSAIGPNDLLHISIANVQGPGVETIKTTRVRDGRVRLPYIQPVACAGLTAVQLEKQIRTAYENAKVAPNVTVSVRRVPNNQQSNAEGRMQNAE